MDIRFWTAQLYDYRGNNNSNNHDSAYGAVIVTKPVPEYSEFN